MGDEDIAGYHTVFRGEATGKVIGVEHLGVRGELVIPCPDQNTHPVAADEGKFETGIAVGQRLGASFSQAARKASTRVPKVKAARVRTLPV